jgi:hypothetical protein
MKRALLSLLTAGLLSGCGEVSYIVLEVHADLQEGDANSLQVIMIDPGNQSELRKFDLNLDGKSFPVDVVLEPSDDTPEQLEEQVTALLDGTPVARIRTTHDWKKGMLTRTVLPPLEPLP